MPEGGGLLAVLGRFGRVLSHDLTSVRLGVTDASVASVIAEVLPRSGYRVYSLVPVQRSLEDVFMGLVEGSRL